MQKSKARTPGVDSARRVLNVLLLFQEETPWLTIEQIAEAVGVSVPSAYRFVSLLRELELVEETGHATYSLTPRVLSLANSAERAFEIGPVVRPVLEHLSDVTGEAALVMRRVGDHAVCAELIQTEHAVRLSFTPGQIMPLERGAGPKLLLAAMGRAAADHYLRSVDFDPAAHDDFLDELDNISRQGWSVSSAEVDEGVWAVAAPVRIGQRTVAALSVAGPRYRINAEREQSILQHVIEQAEAASKDLDELRSFSPLTIPQDAT